MWSKRKRWNDDKEKTHLLWDGRKCHAGVISNSIYRATFTRTETFSEELVFEYNKILFANGTVLANWI
jgi:hypothetical protein